MSSKVSVLVSAMVMKLFNIKLTVSGRYSFYDIQDNEDTQTHTWRATNLYLTTNARSSQGFQVPSSGPCEDRCGEMSPEGTTGYDTPCGKDE